MLKSYTKKITTSSIIDFQSRNLPFLIDYLINDHILPTFSPNHFVLNLFFTWNIWKSSSKLTIKYLKFIIYIFHHCNTKQQTNKMRHHSALLLLTLIYTVLAQRRGKVIVQPEGSRGCWAFRRGLLFRYQPNLFGCACPDTPLPLTPAKPSYMFSSLWGMIEWFY